MRSQNIHLYLTAEHPCGYLPGRLATSLVPDPNVPMTMPLYSRLIALGYRRSGSHAYRPHCSNCDACLPCRIPVADFQASRSQRRCLKRNAACRAEVVEAGFDHEHFELYSRYVNSRHAGGSMANPSEDDFSSFLYCNWSDTAFLEIREQGRLLACAVFDRVEHGLSAVYSYFTPEEPGRSLGTLCVLKLIEHARRMQVDYLYLGYLILECDKMLYKKSYRPLQILRGTAWNAYDAA